MVNELTNIRHSKIRQKKNIRIDNHLLMTISISNIPILKLVITNNMISNISKTS